MFRQLHAIALMAALLWVTATVLLAHVLINQNDQQAHIAATRTGKAELALSTQLLQQRLSQAEQLAVTLALDHSIQALLSADADAELKRINQLFLNLTENLNINQVFLLDNQGTCIASSEWQRAGDCRGQNYADRRYFQEAAISGQGRQFAIGRLVREPSLFFSSALSQDKQLLGVVVVRTLARELTRDLIEDGSITLIADSSGMILAGTDTSMEMLHVGENFAPLPSDDELINTYAQSQLDFLPVKATDYNGITLYHLDSKVHILNSDWINNNNFLALRLKPVAHLNNTKNTNIILAASIIALGLLIIFIIERMINYAAHRRAQLAALADTNAQLSEAMDQLYQLAITDSLTGAATHRFFFETFETEVQRAERDQKNLSLLILDIDKFKSVNDTYGHQVGDKAIRHVVQACTKILRPYDTMGRIGGEEFAILLPQTDADEALKIAERIRQKCEADKLFINSQHLTLTCSIGVACLQSGWNKEQLFSAADKALYAAKNSGRNRIISAEQ
ncbi:MAG TPA: diguanylate cyclase [Cellvibrionaceae bacterium]